MAQIHSNDPVGFHEPGMVNQSVIGTIDSSKVCLVRSHSHLTGVS